MDRGIVNLIVLVGIMRVWREMETGTFKKDELEELLLQRGFMNRLLGSRFRHFISESWQMYPVGLLFGPGFDTASEVGLLAITAAAATQTASSGAAIHIRFLGIIALPLLFAAGMSLMDTADGAFMSRAYGWALSGPVRKVYDDMTTTALWVFVALAIGTIEYIQVMSEQLHLHDPLIDWLNALNFETLGYVIVATFIVAWAGSIFLFDARRVEERWSDRVLDPRFNGVRTVPGRGPHAPDRPRASV